MGIENTVIRVPDIIDGVWFRRWVTEELAKADIRNATAVGATITTDAYGRPVLTFDVTSDVAAHNVDPLAHAEAFAAHRSESNPHTQYLTDAPSDGNPYARQNGAWVIVTAGTGPSTATILDNAGGAFFWNDSTDILWNS